MVTRRQFDPRCNRLDPARRITILLPRLDDSRRSTRLAEQSHHSRRCFFRHSFANRCYTAQVGPRPDAAKVRTLPSYIQSDADETFRIPPSTAVLMVFRKEPYG